MQKVAVYAGTKNLYIDMIPAVKSLVRNSDVDKIYLLIEDDVYPYDMPKMVETINVKPLWSNYIRENSPNLKTRYTYMTLTRALLTKLLPYEDIVLSLDVDTIVDRDISDIWYLPIDGYYFAATREPDKTTDEILYTNTGVALYNLAKLRADGKDDEIIQTLNTVRYQCPEQDVFNYYCQGYIYSMPSEYNSNSYTEATDNPRIIHYAGLKYWRDEPYVLKYRDIPIKDLRKKRKKDVERQFI